MYGTAKAALSRLTQSFAAEVYDDGIAVNAAAPSNPVATPGAGTLDLAKEDTEDISLITETAFLLCTGDPGHAHRTRRPHPAVPARGGLAQGLSGPALRAGGAAEASAVASRSSPRRFVMLACEPKTWSRTRMRRT